ncbi:MAG: hypothetical protein ACJAT7_002133 [Psychromonas sp.]|jgi:hypothetical protein|uniref:hypothetical protein n=1 Tax=Psychromonas sp. TaxID=1884585 RepID=UPI0039E3DA39
MFKKITVFASLALSLSLLVSTAHSDEITLHVPIIDDSPQLHFFFHELLNTAIKEVGHTPKLIPKKLPQLRIKKSMDQGKISIYWSLETNEANKQYIPIEIGLTGGLIGKRVLFIKKGDQHLYDGVKNLDDFRSLNLVAGMGHEWFDVNIWKENNLKYKESSGNWESIFKMIPYGRDYNYISRGVNEIIAEKKQYPKLEIENRLVLIFDCDLRFYLSKTGVNAGAKYQDVIELAIKNAKESGLIDRLVKKYWANNFKALNYDKRIKIHLQMPE